MEDFPSCLGPVYGDLERYCAALCMGTPRIRPEDVLQNTVERALRGFRRLRDTRSFKVWIFRIATNTYRSEVRRSRFKLVDLVGLRPPDEVGGFTHDQNGVEGRLLLEKVLAHLDPREKSAIVLYHSFGFSVKEIAEAQGDRTLSATKSRLSRARRSARARLADLGLTEGITSAPKSEQPVVVAKS